MKYHLKFTQDFRKNPYRGFYIVLEGIDGSGKTTQVENLKKYFEKMGRRVVVTSEPTHELITGKLMRTILKSKVKVPPAAFQFIYSADRIINHATIVEPALKKGHVVISHRAFWSALAHGVVDRDGERLNKETFAQIIVANGVISYYHQFIVPDLTIYLDVSVDTALLRLAKMGKKGDIYENREKLTKVRQAYRWIVANFPKHIKMVNGERSAHKITGELIDEISHYI